MDESTESQETAEQNEPIADPVDLPATGEGESDSLEGDLIDEA